MRADSAAALRRGGRLPRSVRGDRSGGARVPGGAGGEREVELDGYRDTTDRQNLILQEASTSRTRMR